MACDSYGFIEQVALVAASLDTIAMANELFSQEAIDAIIEFNQNQYIGIANDLAKGTLLGHRKIDIDLNLNDTTDGEHSFYIEAIVEYKDQPIVSIPFYTIPGDDQSGITPLDSPSDIKNYIDANLDYQTNQVYTELSTEFQEGGCCEYIQVSDEYAQWSNVDRITLVADPVIAAGAGTPLDYAPIYYWAKTTSGLMTSDPIFGPIAYGGGGTGEGDLISNPALPTDNVVKMEGAATHAMSFAAGLDGDTPVLIKDEADADILTITSNTQVAEVDFVNGGLLKFTQAGNIDFIDTGDITFTGLGNIEFMLGGFIGDNTSAVPNVTTNNLIIDGGSYVGVTELP